MTAPVVQQSSSQGWKVSFVMPSSYTIDDIPKPLNNEIIIKEIPARKMAVIQFNGRNEANPVYRERKGDNQANRVFESVVITNTPLQEFKKTTPNRSTILNVFQIYTNTL